ncbi:transcriptional regulator [Bacillus cereus]|nr:transcriptional regulator [Bacillus cereus]
MSIYEENAELLKVLAHPVRIKIVQELITKGTCNVTELVDILHIPQSTISQHLAKLKSKKVIVNKRRGLEVHYSVSNSKASSIIEILLDKKLVLLK